MSGLQEGRHPITREQMWAEITRLRAELLNWQDAVFHFDLECDQRLDSTNRYRTAWVSAFVSRRRWIKRATQSEAALARVRELCAALNRDYPRNECAHLFLRALDGAE